jgi:hypothetical protein
MNFSPLRQLFFRWDIGLESTQRPLLRSEDTCKKLLVCDLLHIVCQYRLQRWARIAYPLAVFYERTFGEVELVIVLGPDILIR